jgi:NAD(P)-dependent dehydrogenase (short-subunit alcohol dehydrogenase family)
MNELDFRNRTAVVTGGAAGIGLAVAQRLAASGASVAVWDRDQPALAAALPFARGYPVDVADADAVARAAEATVRDMGRIDILVCSAGITGPNVSTWDYPADLWRRVIDVNLNGLFYCNRAVVPRHVEERLRPHRQHRVRRRQGRQSERVGLQHVESGGDRLHQIAGEGAREDGRARQLRDPGRRCARQSSTR